ELDRQANNPCAPSPPPCFKAAPTPTPKVDDAVISAWPPAPDPAEAVEGLVIVLAEVATAGKIPIQPGARGRSRSPGRPGNPDHVADVLRNNSQVSGDLRPRAVGNRVPDGVADRGQVVEIRGQKIDPGPNGRVIVESERFRQSGQMVG